MDRSRTTTASPDHFCPGCGKQLRFGPRTPWRFCGKCIGKATDARGNRIEFIGMGSEWCYADDHGPDAHDRGATGVVCLIMGRPVIVHESRQGGQVAEPLNTQHLQQLQQPQSGGNARELQSQLRGVIDLTNERTLDEVVAQRLVHKGRRVRY